MDIFSELLEQDEFVQKQRAHGRQEGQIKEDQEIIVMYISICYPSLLELAQQRAQATTQHTLLRNIIDRIFAANDEATVRTILSSPSLVA